MSLNQFNHRDEEMEMAAELLLSISQPVLHVVDHIPVKTEPQPAKEYLPPKDTNPLYMIARILTDLNHIRQAPIETDDLHNMSTDYVDHEFPTFTKDSFSGKRRRARKPKTTTPFIKVEPEFTASTTNMTKGRDKLPKEATIPNKKIHKCTFKGCEKVYGKSSHLQAHLRTHTGEKLI